MVLDEKFYQESLVNAAVPQGSILGFTFFLLYIGLHDDVICNTAIYADDTTLCYKCYQTSDLWQQLEMATELESDLWDIVNWGRKWLVDFNTGKTQLISFELSNETGYYWCENGQVCSGGKIIFNMLALPLSSNFDLTVKLCLLLKLPTRNWSFDYIMNFFSPKVALCIYKSITLSIERLKEAVQLCMEWIWIKRKCYIHLFSHTWTACMQSGIQI